MGFGFNFRKKLSKNTSLYVGKKGVSVSGKAGPLTLSSRGNSSIRLGKGLTKRKKLF